MAEREIEHEGRELKVVMDGRVLRSPVPKGIDPKVFRNVVAAVDMLYRTNGMLPTLAEIQATWEGFTRKTVQTALATPELKEALAHRGIDWDSKNGLSTEQLNALLLLSDPTDQRSLGQKLASAGVSTAKYRAWMRHPAFKRQLSIYSEQNLDDAVPLTLNRLIANAEAGDNRAIEKVLEITGRWNPQQQEVQNARAVLQVFIEAMEKHVEPAVLQSVIDEVQKKSKLLALTQI